MTPELGKLRDIHVPGPVSWWPPATGWWILGLFVWLGLALGTWLYLRHLRDRWRRAAIEELRRLRNLEPEAVVREISVLLRRVALHRYPREEVASLSGEAWLAFLDGALGTDAPFQNGAGRILAVGPYAPDSAVDTDALLALCERWIRRLPGGGR